MLKVFLTRMGNATPLMTVALDTGEGKALPLLFLSVWTMRFALKTQSVQSSVILESIKMGEPKELHYRVKKHSRVS